MIPMGRLEYFNKDCYAWTVYNFK